MLSSGSSQPFCPFSSCSRMISRWCTSSKANYPGAAKTPLQRTKHTAATRNPSHLYNSWVGVLDCRSEPRDTRDPRDGHFGRCSRRSLRLHRRDRSDQVLSGGGQGTRLAPLSTQNRHTAAIASSYSRRTRTFCRIRKRRRLVHMRMVMVSRIGRPQPGYSTVEKVFIRCPVKGGPVYTGLDMNPADF